jgi:hypothetical protein
MTLGNFDELFESQCLTKRNQKLGLIFTLQLS